MKEKNVKKRAKKKLKAKNVKKLKCTYVYIANTDKDCDLLHDRPVLPLGRSPHDKTASVLTTAKIWTWVPEGLNAKTDWLTVTLPLQTTLRYVDIVFRKNFTVVVYGEMTM